ncbi:MAG: methyltransferase [Pseudomonadota bacterium]
MGREIPSVPEGYEPSFLEIMAAVRRPGVYLNALIHLFILIPVTCSIAWLSVRLDHHFGFSSVVPAPWNVLLFATLFPLGIYIVWYVYCYLAIKGEGSPGTHLGGTQKLVTSGIFAISRHPSIIGKFVGVLALGLLVGSPIFLFIVIPLLTTWSAFSVRFWQERHCEELWGEVYVAYRRATPSIVPRPGALVHFLRTPRYRR